MALIKKEIIAALYIAPLLLLASCGTQQSHHIDSTPSSSVEEISIEEVENAVKTAVGDAIPYDHLTVKTTDRGRLSISAEIWDSSEITYLATYVDALFSTCNQVVDMSTVHEISLDQCNEEGRIEVAFRTSDGGFGELIDWRSGEAKLQSIANLDELMALFPASKIKENENENLTDTELTIYNEVWEALDANPNRPEEEIFDELAPTYGMTASELKDFIVKAMEKVYG